MTQAATICDRERKWRNHNHWIVLLILQDSANFKMWLQKDGRVDGGMDRLLQFVVSTICIVKVSPTGGPARPCPKWQFLQAGFLPTKVELTIKLPLSVTFRIKALFPHVYSKVLHMVKSLFQLALWLANPVPFSISTRPIRPLESFSYCVYFSSIIIFALVARISHRMSSTSLLLNLQSLILSD